MFEHTPGPWRIKFDEFECEWVINWKGGYAEVNGWFSEDNARLIAAAPDMLEALEVIERYSTCQTIREVATEAVAKAKGQAIDRAKGETE